jgi:hypothetical protein
VLHDEILVRASQQVQPVVQEVEPVKKKSASFLGETRPIQKKTDQRT